MSASPIKNFQLQAHMAFITNILKRLAVSPQSNSTEGRKFCDNLFVYTVDTFIFMRSNQGQWGLHIECKHQAFYGHHVPAVQHEKEYIYIYSNKDFCLHIVL